MIELKKDFNPSSLPEWIEQLKKELKGDDFNKLLREDELEEIKYPTFSHAESNSISVEAPGKFPFTRGSKTKNNDWNNGYLLKVTDEKAANSKALEILLKGCDSLFFDLQEKNEVNWEILLNGIELQYIQTDFRLTTITQFLSIQKHFQNNFPTTLKFSVDFLQLDHSEQLFNALSEEMRSVQRPFCLIDGYSIQQTGATTWQEIAFILATGHEYLVKLIEKGFTIDEAAACIHFSTGIGSTYFYEIAKIRALKKAWSLIIKNYNPIHACSYNCSITAIIGFMNKSLKDPHTNLLRQTTEAMSAIAAGIETIIVMPYDAESISGTSILAERMALNISLILKEESYFEAVIDPLGGSYALEDLTEQIGAKSWALFQKLESLGGISSEITIHYLTSEINTKSEIRKNQIANSHKTLIGINKFINPLPEKNEFKIQADYLGLTKIVFERDLIPVK
jgi:methylmalonyl-CoA mutase